MTLWAVFLAELLILFLTSNSIIQALFHLSIKIFRKPGIAIWPIFILFFPGVVIHEFAHFIVAELLFVRASDLEVSPEINNGMLKMGSVQVRKTDIVRSFLIGVAPIIVGSSVMLVFLTFFSTYINFGRDLFDMNNILRIILAVWVIFFTTNTMFSSKKDLEGSLMLLSIVFFFSLMSVFISIILKFDLMSFIVNLLSNKWAEGYLSNICVLFSIPVVINLLVLFVIGRIVKKVY